MSSDHNRELMIAASEGDFNLAQIAMLKGADANYADTEKDGWTPLMEAATRNHFNVVYLLFTKGAEIEQTTQCGCTVLTKTACEGTPQMMKFLLSFGANQDHINNKGLSLIEKAEVCENQPVVDFLLTLTDDRIEVTGVVDQE